MHSAPRRPAAEQAGLHFGSGFEIADASSSTGTALGSRLAAERCSMANKVMPRVSAVGRKTVDQRRSVPLVLSVPDPSAGS